MRPRRRRQLARGQLDLFVDWLADKKTAADRWNDRRGGIEALGDDFASNHSTPRQPQRFYFVVHERGRFLGIASAPSRSAARRRLITGGVS